METTIEIPQFLATEVRDGKAILLLGAGASMEATDTQGNNPPSASQLAQILAKRFLGEDFCDYPLNQVAEFAINETSLPIVQDFIKDCLAPFSPAHTHGLISKFRWRGIATTNYDLLLEKAYSANREAVQELVPFVKNTDRVDELVHGRNALEYLKLHGCVTRTDDSTCPLILTTDQYLQHRTNRSLLFDRFKAWASDRTVIFLGYRLQDTNIRAILLELERDISARPRYYIVCPTFTATEARFWEQKKMTCIAATASQFLSALDYKVPSTFRGLPSVTSHVTHPISERFSRADHQLSRMTSEFLESDADYVKGVRASDIVPPERFYRGFDCGFAGIAQNLDVRRKTLTDAMLTEHFILDEQNTETLQFFLVKAEAGAGKSVFLRRLAWEASHDYDVLCLYIRPNGTLNSAAVREVAELCSERVYVFVEDAMTVARDLEQFFNSLSATSVRVTVIAAARTNERNSAHVGLTQYITDEYELRYLSENEIDELLVLLERNGCLFNLKELPREERRSSLLKRAGRQLLVALHEATFGKPFEEIILDEYNRLSPSLAQKIYKTICILYRFNAPVRAGIISRLYGIGFEEFREKFFQPLEQVVTAKQDSPGGDYSYSARHPHIAEIVFDVVISDVEERFEGYMKCLQYLDVAYAADRRAFSRLTRGRELAQMFSDEQMVCKIYEVAKERSPSDPNLLHQIAIYEFHRPGGDLSAAEQHLELAANLAKGKTRDLIQHTHAELLFRRAKDANSPLERKKHLSQATTICRTLKRNLLGSHVFHTVVKIGIFRLECALRDEDLSDDELEQILHDTEDELSKGLEGDPGDDYLLSAEADLARLLSQEKRAVKALENAFARNQRNAYVASSLARLYETKGDLSRAADVLRKAVEAHTNDKKLHLAFGKVLLKQGTASDDELLYHFRKAYTNGDRNYEAQLLHGRQLFIKEGNNDACKSLFAKLTHAPVSADHKRRLLHPLPERFSGIVTKLEATYCFVQRDGKGDWVYCHSSNIDNDVWAYLRPSERVSFSVAFTFRGPSAYELQPIGY